MGGSFDLDDIRMFTLAAQSGSLSAAAQELRVATSTVSRSLTRIERRLGLLLVRRGQHGLRLTDAGKGYFSSCSRALRTLRDAEDLLEKHQSHPGGVIKVACPGTMARHVIAPLLSKFIEAYPNLRVELADYSSGWDQEPTEDIDVFFKIRAPRNSSRKVRRYPGTARGLFATRSYLNIAGTPANPGELATHRCIGWDIWKLTKGKKVVAPNIQFHVTTGDPSVGLQLALNGTGITILPLWMALDPAIAKRLVPILAMWRPPSIPLSALYSVSSRLTPKVKVFLDFIDTYLGTDRDPRLHGAKAKDCFTSPGVPVVPGSFEK
jgi:LysR family transcriptional regulator, transcriptional activator for dmlA